METARKTDFSAIFHAPNMWKYLERIEFLARTLAIPNRLRISTDEKTVFYFWFPRHFIYSFNSILFRVYVCFFFSLTGSHFRSVRFKFINKCSIAHFFLLKSWRIFFIQLHIAEFAFIPRVVTSKAI